MDKIRALLSLKKVSISLIAFPYLTFNYEHIVHSPFFSVTKFLIFIIGLLSTDIIIKLIINFLDQKLIYTFSILMVYFNLIFFYGVYLTSYLQSFISENFSVLIRGRSMIEISIFLLLIILFLLKRKNISFQYLNYFFLFFGFISLIISIKNTKHKQISEFKNNYKFIINKDSTVKPVILIISDEYNSPDGLYKVYKDSSVYDFSNRLSKNGWIVKNSFYSYEISTIHSLSSLFNFNLSYDKKYSKQLITEIGASKLVGALLADSLKKKDISIINFGIFHIGGYKFLTYLYMYPKSLFEDIMMSTIFYTIKYNTGNFNESGLASSFYPMEAHNKYIFKNLQDTLNKVSNPKTFIYTHLYMPHSPMQYKPEFALNTKSNLENYTAYWTFTNNKLEPLLLELLRNNKYRIILTGDHGYRNDNRIDPHYTFAAFYGFDKEALENIKSVQDLGSLINGIF